MTKVSVQGHSTPRASRDLSFSVAVLLLASCLQPASPGTTLAVRIDKALLDSAAGLHVTFTLTNLGPETAFVPTCGGVLRPNLERREGARWHSFAGAICQDHLPPVPMELAPGVSKSGTTGAGGSEPGTYRLVMSYATDLHSPRYALATSHPFAVR